MSYDTNYTFIYLYIYLKLRARVDLENGEAGEHVQFLVQEETRLGPDLVWIQDYVVDPYLRVGTATMCHVQVSHYYKIK